jgi:hypothetical protein
MQNSALVRNKPPSEALRRNPQSVAVRNDPVRKAAFFSAVALTFIRCSLLNETLAHQFNFKPYLLYVFGIPTILGILVSGSLLRPFRFKPAYYWLGFALWIVLTVPFSIWKGGSFSIVATYWRTEVIMLFALGALITTWEEWQTMFRAIALACVVSLVTVRIFGQVDINSRLQLEFGMVANSNDYPGHLLMLLPSLLWVASAGKSLLTRIGALAAFGYGIYVILASSSRGALVALAVGFVYFLFSANRTQRVVALAFVPIVLLVTFSFMSEQATQRIFSFSATSSPSEEARESSAIRSRLLKDSVWYALHKPIFGLGPGNFETAEGQSESRLWRPAHNSYTEVASECGIPGLILFVGGIVSSFLIFRRIGRDLGTNVQAANFTYAAFCMRLAMVMFCTAILFLNFSYFFYLPTLGGISIAMGYAADNWKGQATLSADQREGNFHFVRWRRPRELA